MEGSMKGSMKDSVKGNMKGSMAAIMIHWLKKADLFPEALGGGVGGGHLDSCDLGDEGEHGLHSQLGDSHDEGLTAHLHLPLQLLLAVYLHHTTH